jgi:hypothetical protein
LQGNVSIKVSISKLNTVSASWVDVSDLSDVVTGAILIFNAGNATGQDSWSTVPRRFRFQNRRVICIHEKTHFFVRP